MRSLRLGFALLLVTSLPAIADDAFNPHRMVGADGKADMKKCAVCHTDTLDLARPKSEACTLCHSETVHAGSIEHLRASADAVSHALASGGTDTAKPSLTEGGTIYCGTCHLFHDPALGQDKPLAYGRVPARTGIAEAVRSSLENQAATVGERTGTKGSLLGFATEGTTALTMPVEDGSLCLRCHGSYRP